MSEMDKKSPVPMMVTYRPKQGKEAELQALVAKHWPTLAKAGLVTSEPARVWRATDKRSGAVSFIEMFSWKDGESSGIAHQLPEVMALWEPMGPIMEGMSLQQIEQLE
jgi:hypothetical protein